MGNNYGRINPANSRANAQAARYTSNVTGAPIGGQAFQPNMVLKQFPQAQQGGYNGALDPEQQGLVSAAGSPQQQASSLEQSPYAKHLGPGGTVEQFIDQASQNRNPVPGRGGLRGFRSSQGVPPQYGSPAPPYGQGAQAGQAVQPAAQSVPPRPIFPPIPGSQGLAGPETPSMRAQLQQAPAGGFKQFPTTPQQAPEASVGGQPQRPMLVQPAPMRRGATSLTQEGLDNLQGRLAEAQQQESAAAHHLMLSRHHGNPEYNIARGRGTPEEEAAFQGQLAGYRNRDANREFAMTPGGEEMNRFAQLQAMQSNVNQPQGDDTQANLRAMREKGYGDIIMRTRDNRLALTSRGNKARGVRQRETGDAVGQDSHNDQMISAATPEEYMDQAAANRARINDRRAARGGMSEREMRDLKTRSRSNVHSVREDARNILKEMAEGNVGVDQTVSARYGSEAKPTLDTTAAATSEAQDNYKNSELLQNLGVEPGGNWSGYSSVIENIVDSGGQISDEDLTELQEQITIDSHGIGRGKEFWGQGVFNMPHTTANHGLLQQFVGLDTPEERRAWFDNYKQNRMAALDGVVQGVYGMLGYSDDD